MEVNQFIIYSTWHAREDSSARLGERMLHSLDALLPLCPLFRHWWLHDFRSSNLKSNTSSAKGAYIPLDDARGHMTEIAEWGVENDGGEPDPSSGYSIFASNSKLRSSQSVSLQTHGGGFVSAAHPEAGLRYAKFETAYNETPDPEIVAFPVFKGAVSTIESSWNVDYAQVYSQDLMKCWRQFPWRQHFELSWMTYLSEKLARQISVPTDVLVERTNDGGMLMVATEETFNVADPQHMAAARRIRDALAPFNEADDEKDRQRIQEWPKGSLIGRLLNLTLRVPSTGKECLNRLSDDIKSQMKLVLEDLLAHNSNEVALRNAWRRMDPGPVPSDVDLTGKFKTFLAWLQP